MLDNNTKNNIKLLTKTEELSKTEMVREFLQDLFLDNTQGNIFAIGKDLWDLTDDNKLDIPDPDGFGVESKYFALGSVSDADSTPEPIASQYTIEIPVQMEYILPNPKEEGIYDSFKSSLDEISTRLKAGKHRFTYDGVEYGILSIASLPNKIADVETDNGVEMIIFANTITLVLTDSAMFGNEFTHEFIIGYDSELEQDIWEEVYPINVSTSKTTKTNNAQEVENQEESSAINNNVMYTTDMNLIVSKNSQFLINLMKIADNEKKDLNAIYTYKKTYPDGDSFVRQVRATTINYSANMGEFVDLTFNFTKARTYLSSKITRKEV